MSLPPFYDMILHEPKLGDVVLNANGVALGRITTIIKRGGTNEGKPWAKGYVAIRTFKGDIILRHPVCLRLLERRNVALV